MFDLILAVCIYSSQACENIKLTNYAYLTASIQGIDANDFLMLMSCESRGKINAKGDFRSETGEHMAFGPLQWWQSSFNYYSKLYKMKLDRKNPYDQIDLAVRVIKDGGENNWKNCVKIHKLFSYK